MEELIKQILKEAGVIAVVGLSSKKDRPSYVVAKYLKEHGYRIIPINPNYQDILGEKCYPDLRDIPEKVDVVDIFRRPEDVPSVVEDAIAAGAKAVWMQLGIVNEKAAMEARRAGLKVVMDRCIMVEHAKLTAGNW